MTDLSDDTLRGLLDKITPGRWQMKTFRTSCGLCHKVGPFPHQWRGGEVSHACLYEDYPPPGGTPVMVANATLLALAPDLAREVLELRGRVADAMIAAEKGKG